MAWLGRGSAAGAGMTISPSPSKAAVEREAAEEHICRLCWGEADSAWGGDLLSPCRCSGSLKFIHRRCLLDWQRTLRTQGLGRRAATCELCKAPYAPTDPGPRWPRHRYALSRRLAAHARYALSDAGRLSAWPGLALRLWRGYVMVSGVASALRVGAAGFAAGLGVGRALVEEQTSLLGGVLASMSGLLGSPYAELLWCQAVGALLVGMVSEVVYCSVLGGLGGLAYGFASGYVAAIRGSARLVGRVGLGAVSGAAWLAVRALRKVAGAAVRT
ncbi:MAG: hypothetical protein J3K34DRAFT_424983 [Monoraphidium minutum]|nr:MAG: hypothetical protein J3K34DRAFT_424983 [Monoraphidium minutum]